MVFYRCEVQKHKREPKVHASQRLVRLFAGAHVGLKSVDEFQQALFFYPSAGEAKDFASRAPPKSGGGGG